MPDLAILIVSYNTTRDLENCLRSLHDHPPRITHEIVVIDNGSTDGSTDTVRAQFPTVRVIQLGTNVGFARANNEGIRQTMSELILLLNSDTLATDGAIDRLVQALGELPGASIVGPRLVDGTGKPELSFGRMLSPWAEVRQKVIGRTAGPTRLAAMTSHTRLVDWVSGACLLVRRRDAEAAGLLDERYFMYCEDVDFCAAVRANGGRVYFAPAAEVVHLRGRSGASDPGATAEAYRRSQLAFYQKHHPGWEPILRLYLGLRGKLPISKG
ncbi:MAG TPA: glycosyltransferase family 2 protein [Vicinamibacterales bacterium]|nr:glycosyltransferase family 2 protein [Vicinamibacterales bacterium]